AFSGQRASDSAHRLCEPTALLGLLPGRRRGHRRVHRWISRTGHALRDERARLGDEPTLRSRRLSGPGRVGLQALESRFLEASNGQAWSASSPPWPPATMAEIAGTARITERIKP